MPIERVICAGTMKMPVPIMIPMTMAVASHQPNARSNCGGAEAATVVAEPFSGESMERLSPTWSSLGIDSRLPLHHTGSHGPE